MKIRFDDIPETGLEVTLSGQDDVLSKALDAMSKPDGVTIDPRIRGLVNLVRGEREFFMRAAVTGGIRLRCSRCLSDYDLTNELDMDLVVRRVEGDDAAHQELVQADPNEVLVTGDEIDLGEIIAQEFLLDLPMKPLCKDDCPGLCPKCGAMAGSDRCSCSEAQPADPRWEALVKLKEKMGR